MPTRPILSDAIEIAAARSDQEDRSGSLIVINGPEFHAGPLSKVISICLGYLVASWQRVCLL